MGDIKFTYSNAKLQSTLYQPADDDLDKYGVKVNTLSGKNHKLTGNIGLQIDAGIVLGDNGAIFYLDDYVASWASADGKAQGGIVDVKTPLMGANTVGDFGHAYLDVSGSGDNRFAIWSTQTQEAVSETGLGSEVKITDQDIDAALKSTEITAAYYNGSEWTAKNLTENTYADVLPKVASNGNKAVVIWQQGESSGNGETIFDAGKFDVDSRIMMSKFDETDWSAPQTLFSTAAVGELGNMNLALLNENTPSSGSGRLPAERTSPSPALKC